MAQVTYVDIAYASLDLDREDEVGRFDGREAAVHERFVEVKNERLQPSVVFLLRPNHDFVAGSHLL